MQLQVLFFTIAVLTLLTLFAILRSGRMREKYAGLWIIIGMATILLAIWPGFLETAASLLGVQVPSNLLFFLSILLLLGVALHLSLEVSTLEDESRVLAEEVAILQLRLNELDGRGDHAATTLVRSQPPELEAPATEEPASGTGTIESTPPPNPEEGVS